MKQIRLEYQYQQFIEFSLEDYVFFMEEKTNGVVKYYEH